MNLFDTSYVSLKKWHYEKNLHTTASFLLFFLEIYFFKNEFIQSQTKKKKKKKLTKNPFFPQKQSSFNKSRNIILKVKKDKISNRILPKFL